MTEQSESATNEDEFVAMLAHLLTIPGYGLVVLQYLIPLVIFFIYRDKSRFVAFHALQSLFFQLLLLGVTVLLGVLIAVTFGLGIVVVIPALIVVWICGIVYPIIAGVRAHGGAWYEYPLVGAAARRSCEGG